MSFTLEHVQQVRNGYPRQVGQLPDSVWSALGWPCPWVYIGQTGLEHINLVHKDITDFELLHLPRLIAKGLIVHVEKDPRQVIVAYRADGNRIYQSALKSAQSGTEIWVSSFYKVKPKRLEAITRQGKVLRRHL